MIFDQDGNPISSFSTLIESGDVQTYNLRVECRAGYSFYAEVVSDLTLEAKRTLDSSWVDIETTPIDLSPWDGTTQNFQFRVTAGTVTELFRKAFSLRVAHI